MKKLVINGKFYSQKVTGVQRYARESLVELDSVLPNMDVELVLADDAVDVPIFKRIRIARLKGHASVLWEQIKLPLYIKKKNAVGLHLCHVAPLLKPDVVCIHDANVARNPQWFTKTLVLWYDLIHAMCALRAKKILTVSEFSKHELKNIFHISESRIENIGSGWQHFLRIPYDDSVMDRYGLQDKSFYFSLGTRAPHKNLEWVYSFAKENLDKTFVLSGSCYDKVFKKSAEVVLPNVRFLGYLSDSEVKSLMNHCKAFLFPSFYEGFGIPPLEALSVGAKIVVSDIAVMHEIFEDSACYIDPQKAVFDEKMLENAKNNEVLKKYSWKRVALSISSCLQKILCKV